MCDELNRLVVVLTHESCEGSRTEQVVAARSSGNCGGQPVTARNGSEVDYHLFC
jgi:hypothetical protein